jgi:methyltransferase-like protein/SAM-dependent methyltransferase
MMSDSAASYDEVPYESYAFPQSHPRHLASVAALFGMEPGRLEEARVLEIGCAGGGNLLPMAAAYPSSWFVGVDVSPVQIGRAREAVEALGFRNVRLHACRLESLDDTSLGGTFDYIIAHGFYSWVPAPVREALLDLCGRLLKPRGVAYVSYNTLPGAAARGTLRDMIRYHRGDGADASLPDRIREARQLLSVLGEALENREEPYAKLMMGELTQVAGLGDFYLAHEHLEENNEPCYFHEFMTHCRRHGLQYLGDAEMQTMAATDLPETVRKSVRAIASNIEEAEQYHDFIRNRAFRQTLLCRGDIELKRSIAPDLVRRFHFASSLRPVDGSAECREWRDAAGSILDIAHPLARAALAELQTAWPACVSFQTLLAESVRRTNEPAGEPQAAILARALLTCFSASRGVEFHLYPPALCPVVSPFPAAPPIVRWQAARGGWITSLRHENVSLGPRERLFLTKIDGTRSDEELAAESEDGREMLQQFARMALLAT